MNGKGPSLSTASSSAPASFPPFFRRRTLGRAPSPPTWACYEQIPPPLSDSEDEDVQTDSDSHSFSESDAEDEQELKRAVRSDSPGGEMEMDMDMEVEEPEATSKGGVKIDGVGIGDALRDVRQGSLESEHACGSTGEQCNDDGDCEQGVKKQDKGKQRAIEPEIDALPIEKSPKRKHRKRRHNDAPFIYRPILTIKKSDGFVWNQDLFVPSYIKDRYIASTTPPSSGFTNTSASSSVPASEFNDGYEIEVVEIRVQGNELDGILP